MNWSDWMNMSDICSFDGNGRVRLITNASDLVKMFEGDSGGNAVNATISFIEGTNSSEIKVETASTTPGLTVLPTDVWMRIDSFTDRCVDEQREGYSARSKR
jgi:hypothetical protein